MMIIPELPFEAQEFEKLFRAAPKQLWFPGEPNSRAKVLFQQYQYVKEAENFEFTIQQLQRLLNQLRDCERQNYLCHL